MTFIFLLVGLLPPALFGWLLIRAIEGKGSVLSRGERAVWASLIGPMIFTFVVFISHITIGVPFTLVGYAIPLLVSIGALILFLRIRSIPFLGIQKQNTEKDSPPMPGWMRIGIGLLILWTVIKVMAGGYDLLSVPTYHDDAFNNWNMRAKVFHETKELTLEFESQNDLVQTATGVNSYPPGVPLLKVWLTVLRGSWHEPTVNGLHLLWYVGLLVAFGLVLRHQQGSRRALIGLYALASLPLVLIQGMSAYADVALASYLFLALWGYLGLMQSSSHQSIRTWAMLTGLAIGAMLFVKNEALLLYTPLLTLLGGVALHSSMRAGHISLPQLRNIVFSAAAIVCIVLLPWIAFKWMNGLTFGNAKSIGESTFSFHPRVPKAIWYMLTKEANFLILPLAFLASIGARWQAVLQPPVRMLVLFVLAAALMQFSLFTFVDALINEAINQTGLGRGLVHIAPIALLSVFLLWPPKVQRE